MMIGRSIERGTAMIVIGSFVWIIICPFVKGRGWRTSLRLVSVSLPIACVGWMIGFVEVVCGNDEYG